MQRYSDRPIGEYAMSVLLHCEGKDAIIVESGYWLKSAGVIEIKRRVELATNRVVLHFRSMGAEPHELVKRAIVDYYAYAYNVVELTFRQSQDEHRMSEPDAIYFHGVGVVRGTVNETAQTNG